MYPNLKSRRQRVAGAGVGVTASAVTGSGVTEADILKIMSRIEERFRWSKK